MFGLISYQFIYSDYSAKFDVWFDFKSILISFDLMSMSNVSRRKLLSVHSPEVLNLSGNHKIHVELDRHSLVLLTRHNFAKV